MNPLVIEDLIQPIKGLIPAGKDARYQCSYETMEQEIKKFGSLREKRVNWQVVQHNTTQVLTLHSKDIKAACYLVRAMLEQNSIRGLEQGLTLLFELISRFGNSIHPQRNRARDGAFSWLDHQLNLCMPKMGLPADERHLLVECQQRITQIQHAFSAISHGAAAPLTSTSSIINRLIAECSDHIAQNLDENSNNPVESCLPEFEPSTQPPSLALVPITPHHNQNNHLPAAAVSLSPLSGVADELKKIAKRILISDPTLPISYRLHRHLSWANIAKQPQSNHYITVLALAVSEEKIAKYREKATPSTAIEHIKSLEIILTDSPFWFTGHHLVYLLLEKLGYQAAANAVADETRRFIHSLAGIEQLQFINLQPFADDATRHWLANTLTTDLADTMGSSEDIHGEYHQPQHQIVLADLGQYIEKMNKQLELARSGRDHFLVQIQMITIFYQLKLFSLNLPYLEQLWAISEEMHLAQWEPQIFLNLKMITKSTLKALYPTKKQLPVKYQQWQSIYRSSS